MNIFIQKTRTLTMIWLNAVLWWCLILLSISCGTSVETVQQLGSEKNTGELLEILKGTDDPEIRMETIHQLGLIGNPVAWSALIAFANQPLYKTTATIALLQIIPFTQLKSEHLEFIKRTYLDTDPSIQAEVERLAKAHYAEMLPLVIDWYQDEHYRLRGWIATMIGSSKDPAYHKPLMELTLDDNSYVRLKAVLSIAQMDIPDKMSLLYRIQQNDLDPEVQKEAARSIDRLSVLQTKPILSIRLGVLPFDNETGKEDYTSWETQIANRISSSLSAKNLCYTIEQTEINKAIESLEMQQTDFYDPTKTAKIGQFVGCDQIIYGKIQKKGLEITLVAKRMKVETGEILFGAEETGYESEWNQLIDRVIQALIRSF